jgi:hypothetical protein
MHAVFYSCVAADRYGDSLLGGSASVLIISGIAGIVLITVSALIAGLLACLGPLLCLRAGSVLTSRLAALATGIIASLVLVSRRAGIALAGASALRPGLPLTALRGLAALLALPGTAALTAWVAVIAVLTALAGLASLRGLPSLLSLAAGRALLIIRRTAFVFLFPETERFVYTGLKARLLLLLLLRIVSALVVQIQLAAPFAAAVSIPTAAKSQHKHQNQ